VWLPQWPSQRRAVAQPELDDRQALERLAEWCGQFSPMVGLEDSAAPESLLLDITGLEPLFGSETALAQKVVRALADRGLAVRAAVADTIGTAWAVAHYGEGQRAAGRMQQAECKMQNPKCKVQDAYLRLSRSSFIVHHSSFILVLAGAAANALRPLPIEALRLPGETVDLLHQLGVHRIAQLEKLPREELGCRFGPRLVQRWDQALGRLAEPIPAHPLPPELEAQYSLEYPTAQQETIKRILEQLIGRLAERLVQCGRGVVQLRCRLECQSAGSRELSVGLFQATASAQRLLQLARVQLERLALPAPVSAVYVQAAVTARLPRRQEELFPDGRAQQHRRELADLIERLSGRLGSRSVLCPRLLPEAQPELAYRYDPLVGALARKGSRRGRSPNRPHPDPLPKGEGDLPLRPLRLVSQALALAVISIVPDGPPLQFRFSNHPHHVAQTWGPERIETGWWRGRGVERDYYRIESTSGRRFWVFRRRDDGKWFMHGTFE